VASASWGGLFEELPASFVADEDRAEGWTPLRWQM